MTRFDTYFFLPYPPTESQIEVFKDLNNISEIIRVYLSTLISFAMQIYEAEIAALTFRQMLMLPRFLIASFA